jgi:DNA-binding transcriptional LysR family regulator
MASDLSLNQLRAFYFATKCGSISKAAERLFISQPAVSMQIKALEQRYNVTLFAGKGRNRELTEFGKKLFTISERIFGLIEEADELLHPDLTVSSHILKIGSTKTLVRYLLARYISRFQEAFPNIQIQIDEGSSGEMVQSVLENRNDLVIAGRVPYDRKLKVIPFIQDEVLLLAAPGHRLCERDGVTVEDLRGENLILREKGSGVRMLIEKIFAATGVVPSTFIETGNVDFIKELVAIGKGITMLARMGVDQDMGKGLLKAIPLRDGPFILDIDIVLHRERKLSRADEAFLNVLLAGARTETESHKLTIPGGLSYDFVHPSI